MAVQALARSVRSGADHRFVRFRPVLSGSPTYFIDSPEVGAAACHIREAAACRIQAGVGHTLPAVVGARNPLAAVAVAGAVQRYSPTASRLTPVEGLNAKASFETPCSLSAN